MKCYYPPILGGLPNDRYSNLTKWTFYLKYNLLQKAALLIQENYDPIYTIIDTQSPMYIDPFPLDVVVMDSDINVPLQYRSKVTNTSASIVKPILMRCAPITLMVSVHTMSLVVL